jgi:hypothetical protein
MTGSSAVRLNVPDSTEKIECSSAPFDFASTDAGSPSFTIEAWIYVEDETGFARIASKEIASPRTGYSVSIKQFPTEVLFERWESGTTVTYITRALPGLSQWVHVAATWDGTNAKIYVNGVAGSKGYGPLTFSSTPNPLTFGLASSGVGGSFKGKIDEIAVYPSALSSLRIATHIAAATTD